jgi:hypothetical protein
MSLFMGRVFGWRKEHVIEMEAAPCFFGCQQMPEVDGIEGAAEDSNPQATLLHTFWYKTQARHL